MARGIGIITGSQELLSRVEPLWKELNAFHIGLGTKFSGDLAEQTFGKRREDLIGSAESLYIAIVSDGTDVGYCIASVDDDGTGEIDSLYLKQEYRSKGLGRQLVESALRWLDDNNARKKMVVVLERNTEALAFYERIGFRPRNVELEYTDIG